MKSRLYISLIFLFTYMFMVFFMFSGLNIVDFLLVGADWSGIPYNLEAGCNKYLYAWSTFYLGTSHPYSPIEIFHSILGYVLTPTLTSNLLLALSFLLSFTTMFFLIKKYFIKDTNYAFLGSFFYSINPFTLGVFHHVGINWLLPYSILPFVLILMMGLYTSLKQNKFDLTSILMAGFGLGLIAFFPIGIKFLPLLGVVLVGPLVFILIEGGKDYWKKIIFVALLLMGIGILINLPMFYGLFISPEARATHYIKATSAIHTYKTATPLNLMRFHVGRSDYGKIFGYNTGSYFGLAGFFFSFLISLGLIFKFKDTKYKKIKNLKIMYGLYLSWLLLISVSIVFHFFPFQFASLINTARIFYTLRNPQKLLVPIMLISSILLSYSTYILGKKFDLFAEKAKNYTGRIKPSDIVLIFVLLILISYNLPIFYNLFDDKYQPFWFRAQELNPHHYDDYIPYLRGEHRTLILPYDYELMSAVRSILIEYNIAEVGYALTGAKKRSYHFWIFLYNNIKQKNDGLSKYLARRGIKYVAVDKTKKGLTHKKHKIGTEINQRIRGKKQGYIYLEPDEIIDVMDNQPRLEKVKDNPDVTIYKNKDYKGVIYSAVPIFTDTSKYVTSDEANTLGLPMSVYAKKRTESSLALLDNLVAKKDLNVKRLDLNKELPSMRIPTKKWGSGLLLEVFRNRKGFFHNGITTLGENYIANVSKGSEPFKLNFKNENKRYLYMKVLLTPKTHISIEVDGKKIRSVIGRKETKSLWTYISSLDSGNHTLKLYNKGEEVYVDEIILIDKSPEDIKKIFSKIDFAQVTPEVQVENVSRINPTLYEAYIKANNSVFIVLTETFSKNWVAIVDNYEIPSVLTYQGVNGFYIPKEYLSDERSIKVKIFYKLQEEYQKTIVVQILMIGFLLTYLFYDCTKKGKLLKKNENF